MRRRSWALGGAAALAAVTVAGGVVFASGGDGPDASEPEPPTNTAQVQRGELAATVSLDGTLTYRARADGSAYSAINRAKGIYTELPAAGDRVDCGDAFYRVDDDPVLLLCGAVPAYRDLETGDRGEDVRQLNRNLGLPADREFTWETHEALERLQGARDMKETGELEIGDAVFLPRPARIAKVTGRLGGAAQPGAQVAQATSATLEVQVALDSSQQSLVKQGDRATITLPSNASARGKVQRLGRVAQAPSAQDGGVESATVPAYIALDRPGRARGLDRAPVQVDITTKGVAGVLSVPVTALVGKAGGGYAVEVVTADGHRELVAVTLGLFDSAAGRVEVEGDLRDGDQVVVPAE
jgi:hypothetical protein